MDHDTTLLLTIVTGLVLAFALGFAASKLRLPPLVGYLIGGIAVGPFTPGLHVDPGLAGQLAEIGIILLMFGVGLHFSPGDLLAVRWIAIPGAVVQIAVATAIGAAVASTWGWSPGAGIVLGLSLSVASTVVLLRALDERNALGTANGRIAVGWLIVEDLAMVLALVLLPALAGLLGGRAIAGQDPTGADVLLAVALTVGKVVFFGALILVLGPRLVPWLLGQAARTGSHELFTLSGWPRPSASPTAPPRSSMSPSRSAPSAPALCSAAPTSAIAPRPSRCRSRTPSPSCSSSPSGCCSIRRS